MDILQFINSNAKFINSNAIRNHLKKLIINSTLWRVDGSFIIHITTLFMKNSMPTSSL